MFKLHRFFRPDGTNFQVRSEVTLPLMWDSNSDYCDVVVETTTARNKFKGGEVYGFGRFAPIRSITVATA